MPDWGHGHGVIMDKHYRIVKSVEAGGYQASSDMHEFLILPDGKSALMTQYQRSVQNLCDYGLCSGLGYVNEGVFQEVEIETGNVLFEWRSLDHVDLSESYVPPSTTGISSSGMEPASPWDYFHLNSVDKDVDGDYLISAHHVSTIYKISGKDGSIIWRLNGPKSDFRLIDFQFSSQYDARFVSSTEDSTSISLFSNGFNETQSWSTALLMTLNHTSQTATAIRNYDSPLLDGSKHVAKSQGNFQRLNNGNALLGWGTDACWSEHLEDGTTVFYGGLGRSDIMNYRVHKFDNWIGLPLTKPALWTYSRTGEEAEDAAGMMLYASWNGATEVKRWTFYTSNSKSGPWLNAATVAKNGYETVFRLSSFYAYTYAEAIDSSGTLLGTSDIQRTFVPSPALRPHCDDLACRFVPDDEETKSQIDEVAQRQRAAEIAQMNRPWLEEQARKKKRIILLGTLGGLLGFILLTGLAFSIRRPLLNLVARFRKQVGGGGRSGRYKLVMSPLPGEVGESIHALSWMSGGPTNRARV